MEMSQNYGAIERGETDAWSSLDACIVRESVDSLCRDDADMPKPPCKRKACNLPNVAFVSLFREIIVILESHSTQQHS